MQAIIHIGVNIRLFPTTGMTLFHLLVMVALQL